MARSETRADGHGHQFWGSIGGCEFPYKCRTKRIGFDCSPQSYRYNLPCLNASWYAFKANRLVFVTNTCATENVMLLCLGSMIASYLRHGTGVFSRSWCSKQSLIIFVYIYETHECHHSKKSLHFKLELKRQFYMDCKETSTLSAEWASM